MPRLAGQDWALLTLLSCIWGGSFFFMANALDDGLAPLAIAGTRISLGAVTLLALLPLLGAKLPRGWRVWRDLLILGILSSSLPFTLIATAQETIPSGVAAILNATTPITTALIAHAVSGDDRLSLSRALGVLTGFTGVLVLVGPSALGALAGAGHAAELWAELLMLLATLSYGASGVLGRRIARGGISGPQITAGALVCAALVSNLALLVWAPVWTWPMPGPRAMLSLLVLGCVSTGIAWLLHFRILVRAGATNASLSTFLVPVTALALGLLVRAEPIEGRHLAGFAVILGGLLLLDGRPVAAMRRVLRAG